MINTDNKIIELYVKSHPTQAISLIEDFDDPEIAALLNALPLQTSTAIIRQIVPYKAVRAINYVEDMVLLNIFSQLPIKKAGNLLIKCEGSVKKKILQKLPRERRESIEMRMQYANDSVGGQMETDVLTLRKGQKIQDGLEMVRKNVSLVQPQIYVLNQQEEMEGYVELKDLLKDHGDKEIDKIVRDKPMTFLPSINIEDLLSQWDYQFIQLPVVDAEGVFLGTISRKVIKEYAGSEDIQKQPAYKAGSALSELYRIGFISLLGASQESSYKNNPS